MVHPARHNDVPIIQKFISGRGGGGGGGGGDVGGGGSEGGGGSGAKSSPRPFLLRSSHSVTPNFD